MRFLNFLKEVFFSKFWIKAMALALAFLVTFLLNI